MVSYGLAYGMESFGLAQRLGIEVDEAAEILKAYFDSFPRVRAYMDQVVAEARDKGYTETLFGRRRLIPELASQRYQVRMAGERQAMNAGIQGLAADIFKVALVRLDARLGRGRPSQQAHPAGPRRGPPRGTSRRGGCSDQGDPGSDARGGAAFGAAGSQPVVGKELGRRQAMSVGRRPGEGTIEGGDPLRERQGRHWAGSDTPVPRSGLGGLGK